MIKLQNVSRFYPAQAGRGDVVRALDTVSLHVGPGEWLAEHKEEGQTFEEYIAGRPVTPTGKRNIIYVQPLGEFTEAERKVVKLTADPAFERARGLLAPRHGPPTSPCAHSRLVPPLR